MVRLFLVNRALRHSFTSCNVLDLSYIRITYRSRDLKSSSVICLVLLSDNLKDN